MEQEAIIATLGAVGGILTILTGFIIKLHINRSKCGAGGRCFDCICDEEELQTLQRHRTEKRRRESMADENNYNDEYITVEIDIEPIDEEPKRQIIDV